MSGLVGGLEVPRLAMRSYIDDTTGAFKNFLISSPLMSWQSTSLILSMLLQVNMSTPILISVISGAHFPAQRIYTDPNASPIISQFSIFWLWYGSNPRIMLLRSSSPFVLILIAKTFWSASSCPTELWSDKSTGSQFPTCKRKWNKQKMWISKTLYASYFF